MIASATDIALIVDVDGVIHDIAVGDGDARRELSGCWLGQRLIDTVTPESRASIEEMLGEVRANGVSRRHQVTHLSEQAGNLPVAYTAVRLGRSGDIAAIGRDIRVVNELQERLVEAQQALERDYVRMCHIETRYRQLFQLSSEAVVVVDRGSLRVAESNPAAAVLLGLPPGSVVGRTFTAGMDAIGRRAVGDHLAAAGANGRAEPVRVSLADGRAVMLSASPIRQQGSELFLVRLRPDGEEAYAPNGAHNSRSLGLIDAAPDAFVVADREGRVLTSNRAFLDLVQLTSLEQARGLPLGEWLGRPGADLPILLATLKEHGVVRLFSTAVRGQYGSTVEVELSAVASADPTGACTGFIIRDVGRRLAKGPQGAQDLACAIERLTGVVGRVSLHDLVRDTVDLVERHFVAAALELTHDNRTAAAQVLGVSRQSLYVKLRRYGLGPSASEQDAG